MHQAARPGQAAFTSGLTYRGHHVVVVTSIRVPYQGSSIMKNGRKKGKKAGLKAGLINSINNRVFEKMKILDLGKFSIFGLFEKL